MGKTSLRAYNRKIESLIDQKNVKEAVAHCKYILRQFPKHIETYRLLGKAYLVERQYSEAADIFKRVLSALPDNFFAHLGMSIIREDEGNYDAGIWHMERAYESQPSNPAIQDELRRLYGKRDGIIPSRIRLTRGALVRMYAQGELYSQATAEAHAALREDPQRLDLRLVLARMAYKQGNIREAAEICSQIIRKSPYCYEANQILADILPATKRADETSTYVQRLIALDPYSPFLKNPSENTDDKVTLEELEYHPEDDSATQRGWSQTVGVNIGEDENAIPTWLSAITSFEDEEVTPSSETISSSTPSEVIETDNIESLEQENIKQVDSLDSDLIEDAIPDFLKKAGWVPAPSEHKENLDLVSQERSDELQIAKGEVPDWMMPLAPVINNETLPEDSSRTQLLEQLLNSASNPQKDKEGDLASGNKTSISTVEMETEGEAILDTPEFLVESAKGAFQPEELDGEEHNLFKETGPVQAGDENSSSQGWITSEELLSGETVGVDTIEIKTSSTLSDLKSEEAVTTDERTNHDLDSAMKWLDSISTGQTEEINNSDTIYEDLSVYRSNDHQDDQGTLNDDTLEASRNLFESPKEEGIKSPILFEELPTSKEKTQPVMLSVPEPDGISVQEAELLEPKPNENKINNEFDDAFAWLESLASNKGSDEETSLVSPENPSEISLEWLQNEQLPEKDEINLGISAPTDLSVEKLFGKSEGDLSDATEGLSSENELLEPKPAWEQFLEKIPEGEEPLPEWQQRLLEVSERENNNLTDDQSTASEMEIPASEDVLPAWLRQLSRANETKNPDKVEGFEPTEQRNQQAREGNPPDLEPSPSIEAKISSNGIGQEVPNSLVDDDTGLEEFLPEWVQHLGEDFSESPELILDISENTDPKAPDLMKQENITGDVLPEWVHLQSKVEEITDNPTKRDQVFNSGEKQEYPIADIDIAPGSVIFENDETGFVIKEQAIPPSDVGTEDQLVMNYKEPEALGFKEIQEIESIDLDINSRKGVEFTDQLAGNNNLPEWLFKLEDAILLAPEKEARLENTENILITDEDELLEWLQKFSESGEIAKIAKEGESFEVLSQEQVFSKEREEITSEQIYLPETEEVKEFFQVEKIDKDQVATGNNAVHEKETYSEIVHIEQPANLPAEFEEINAGTQFYEDQPQSEELNIAADQAVSIASGFEPEELPDWLRGLEEQELTVTDASNRLAADKLEWLEPESSQDISESAPIIERGNDQSNSEMIVNFNVTEVAEPIGQEEKSSVDEALIEYEQRVNEGKNLDRLIDEVKTKIYEHPGDFTLWQVLGDAYLKANQIQNALDAYKKAEELIL